MKGIMLLLSITIAYIRYSLCFDWKIEYRSTQDSPPLTEFTIHKGEYLPLMVRLIKQSTTTTTRHAIGKITIDNAQFQLADEISIDTIEQREYLLHLGVACDSSISDKTTLNLKVDTESSALIEWTSFTVSVSAEKPMIDLKLQRDNLELNSYSLYTVASVRNVDPIKISYSVNKGKEVYFPPYQLPRFNTSSRRGLSLFGTFSAAYDETVDQNAVTPSLNNTCFRVTERLSWRMALTNLQDLFDKKASILMDTDVDRSNCSTIQFHLKLEVKPALVSCALSGFRDEAYLSKEIITHPFQNTGLRTNNFDFFQVYHQIEGTATIFFNYTNRFSVGYTATCYIQALMLKNGKEEQETLKLTLSNAGERDKTLTLKSELPFPSQCIFWDFNNELTVADVERSLMNYCRNYFSQTVSLSERGCLRCESRAREFLLSTEIGLCIRSQETCTMNYPGNIKGDVADFLKTIDSKDKLNARLGLSLPELKSSQQLSEDDPIDTSKFQVKIRQVTMKGISINVKTNINQSLDCFCKQINKQPFKNVTEGDFIDILDSVYLFPGKENQFSLQFSKEGYDNVTYSVVFMCFNFANYNFHSRHSPPFILTTFLRTNLIPKEENKDQHDCSKDNKHALCVPHNNNLPPKLKSRDYRPDIESELFDFSKLSDGYKYLMLNDELNEYNQTTLPADVIDKTIYLLELLPIEDCIAHLNSTYCREMKRRIVKELVGRYIGLFPADSLLKAIEGISDQPRKNVVLLGMALFDFGNNPEAYDLVTLKSILQFTQKIVDSYDALLKLIDQQQPVAGKESANADLIQNAKQDFTHLLLLTQVNFLNAFTYLELDKEIKVNSTSKLISNELIKPIFNNIEKLLPYFARYGYKSIVSGNIHVQIFNKLQTNSDDYNATFSKYNITVTFQKEDILLSSDADFLYIFLMDNYPFIPFMSPDYYNHTISLRLYKRNEGGPVARKSPIEPAVKVLFSLKGVSSSFTEAMQFDHKTMQFINKRDDLRSIKVGNESYLQMTVNQVGDYSFGVKGLVLDTKKMTGQTWAIIGGSIGGGILLIAGLTVFIRKYRKRKKRNEVVDVGNIEPIMQE